MSEKTAVHEPSSHEIEPALGNEISSRLESEKSWFAITTKKDLDSKMIATEKTVEDLTQRLQWLYESLEKSKNELKEKEAEVKLILQEREKLLIRLSEFRKKMDLFKKKVDQVYADEEGMSSVSPANAGLYVGVQASPHSQGSDEDKETP